MIAFPMPIGGSIAPKGAELRWPSLLRLGQPGRGTRLPWTRLSHAFQLIQLSKLDAKYHSYRRSSLVQKGAAWLTVSGQREVNLLAAIDIVVLRPGKVGLVAAAVCLLAEIIWLYDAESLRRRQ
jgi:hypothetical protein